MTNNTTVLPPAPFEEILRKLAEGIESGHIVGLAVVACAPDGTPSSLWVELPGSEGGLADGVLQLLIGYGTARVVQLARDRAPRIVRPDA